jgi:hypothetical protein
MHHFSKQLLVMDWEHPLSLYSVESVEEFTLQLRMWELI